MYTQYGNFHIHILQNVGVVWIKAPYKDGWLKTRVSLATWERMVHENVTRIHGYKSCGHSRFKVTLCGNKGKRETLELSRWIAKTPSHLWADHISRQTFDNLESNIRNVEPWQNSRNGKHNTPQQANHIGVYYHAQRKGWMVCAKDETGKRKTIKYFPEANVEDACHYQEEIQNAYNFLSLEQPIQHLIDWGKKNKQPLSKGYERWLCKCFASAWEIVKNR